MTSRQSNWTKEQLIVALDLYCRTPFGRLHRGNPDIIALAQAIGRTASAVAMKLSNFASFDPIHQKRGIQGLKNSGQEDRRVWEEYERNWELLVLASADAKERLGVQSVSDHAITEKGEVPTEVMRPTKVRLVQGFFRDAVLASYNFTCSFCGLCLTEMLTASHIIPWSCDEHRRADPRNGLALCTFHDRAFDRGLMTVRCDLTIGVSGRVRTKAVTSLHQVGLLDLDGQPMRMPARFAPDPDALKYHNDEIFR